MHRTPPEKKGSGEKLAPGESDATASGVENTYVDDTLSVHPSKADLSIMNQSGNPFAEDIDETGGLENSNPNQGKFVKAPQTLFTPQSTAGMASAISWADQTAAMQEPLRPSASTSTIARTVSNERANILEISSASASATNRTVSNARQSNAGVSFLEHVMSIEPDDRTMYIAGLGRQWENSEGEDFQQLPKFAIEAQLDVAEKYWNRFLDAHRSVFLSTASSEARELSAELHFQIESLYTKLKARLRQRMHELDLQSDPAGSGRDLNDVRFDNRLMQRGRNDDLGIQRMEVRKFDGDYKSWPSFKSMFESYFHNNKSMPAHTKMFRLVSCLVPNSEAHELVVGLDVRGENYETAWATLCDFYNDERKILDDLINEFLDIPRITRPDRASLVNLKIKTQNLMESMPKYNINTDQWGVWLVPLLVRKLDYASLALWARQRPKKVKPEVQPLLDFITTRSESIDDEIRAKREQNMQWRENKGQHRNASNMHGESGANNNNASARPSAGSAQANANTMSNRDRKRKCPDPLCKPNNNHPLHTCHRFRSLDLETRKRKVAALGVCALCLRKECEPSKCHMTACRECDELHNSYLCPAKAIAAVPLPKSVTTPLVAVLALESAIDDSSESSGTETWPTVPSHADNATLLATAIITINDKDGQPIQFRALCDQGAEVNLITNNALQQLQLKRTARASNVSGIGGMDLQLSGAVEVMFKSRNNTGKSFALSALITRKITNRLPSTRLCKSKWPHLKNLTLADPHFDMPQEVDILLGASVYSELVRPKIARGESGEPIAQCTHVGWIVFGPVEVQSKCLRAVHSITNSGDVDGTKIDELLQKFWEVECVPQRHIRTREEQFCEDHFVRNTTRDNNGRYVVMLPINSEAGPLGNSRQIAQRRFLQMEQRFLRSPEMRENYTAFMNEYLSLGHMREAPPLPPHKQHYFIPHHAAGTKKFRVVFDGSSKTSNGTSLNDVQCTGEKLQSELTTIMMRFRTHKIALTADIKKMYRQVLIHPDQMDYQRIIWRDDPNKPMKEFQLTTQTYGLRSAPHNCIRALKQCAFDYEVEHPLAAAATHRDFYVDDFISGAHTVQEAMDLYNDMNAMMPKGGFELAKWATNSARVHDKIGIESSVRTIAMNSVDEGENSVLGLKWASLSDTFKYKVAIPPQGEKVTKRKIVSYTAKIYDPNGYLAAVAITAKIIIQKLWIAGVNWDGDIPDKIRREWNKFIHDLPNLSNVRIKRWIGSGGSCKTELHGFCDASDDAYGCAIYIKVTDESGNAQVNLVMARTRVAPIKRRTVPRMELCGAHLLAKTLDDVRAVHNVAPNDCYLWSDSMIVLHWLSKEPANARTYVANRLAETGELTKNCTWRHISTKENPADLASRGISASEIVENKLWWHGPAWLLLPQTEWPATRIELTPEQLNAMHGECNPRVAMIAVVREPLLANARGDLIEQFGNQVKLYRVTAWVRRFITNAKSKKEHRISGPLTEDEYLRAEGDWLKEMQKCFFAAEIECCQKALSIPKTSKLVGLRPFIDFDGVLRCSSRLQNALLPFDNKCPIVLSSESALTKLIIRSAHKVTMHSGAQATMQYVRYKFWAPKLRSLTRSIIYKCVICTRHRGEPMTQMMGWLPKARVTPGRAFKQTGVDYCGPFTIKARSGRCKTTTKGYVAVFVCMKVKAVHLELVSDLTSEAFLAALSRFSARRGRVHELFSDNGTTFHGADTELAAAMRSWKKVADDLCDTNVGTKWTFIPPVSPHHGGIWERAVRSAKFHMRRVIGDHQLTFEEMSTVLAKIEACLNSRPIGRISDDSADNCALTPAHFLVGEPLVAPLTRDVSTTPENRLRRWKLLEKFTQSFWHRWRDEYLDQMLTRSKWKLAERNAAIDDIVLVRSDNTPATQWPLGIIVAVYPGPDGLVRSVDVRLKDRVFRRSISKLILLPTDPED